MSESLKCVPSCLEAYWEYHARKDTAYPSLQTYLLPPGLETLQDSIEDLPPKDWDAWIDVLGYSDTRSRALGNLIMSIVYNPYWGRLWIAQEVSVAQTACIIFGKSLLGKDSITAMYFAARENSKPGYRSWITRQRDPGIKNSGTHLLDHHPMMSVGCKNGDSQPSHEPESLGRLIVTHQWQACTDPQDHVFGLVGLIDWCPAFEIDYTVSNEEVAIRTLNHFEDEGTQETNYQLGLDLSAAAALLKCLTVTSLTFLRYEQTLPFDRVEALLAKRFHLLFKPLIVLKTDDCVQIPEVEAYEDVVQLNVSGALTTNLYRMQHRDYFRVKLLGGQTKQFTYSREVNRLEKKSGVALLCWIHLSPALIVCWDPDDDRAIRIEHFIWPDTTRPLHKVSEQFEIHLPRNVRDALQREINACGVDWDDLSSDTSSNHIYIFLPRKSFPYAK